MSLWVYPYFGVQPNTGAVVQNRLVYFNNWHLTVPRVGAQRFEGLYHLTISVTIHQLGQRTIRFYFDANGDVLRFQREGGAIPDPLMTAINTHIGDAVRAIGSEFAGLIVIMEGTDRIRFKPGADPPLDPGTLPPAWSY